MAKRKSGYTEQYGSESPGPGWTNAGDGRWVYTGAVENGGEPRIAVLGGGPGGMFATYTLNQRLPGASVTLFEATGRLGGKIFTDCFSDGTPFEAGVAELYEYRGPGDDPLRSLIENDLGLKTNDMSGGAVILGEDIYRDLDEVRERQGDATANRIKAFHRRMVELMPLGRYAARWQPDNDHPWADDCFLDCVKSEIGNDPFALRYVLTAVHSDLATEPHTCNGLNGIKNVLMDNDEYMQLYHVQGGIERVVDRLAGKLEADVRLGCRVRSLKRSGDGYSICWKCHDGGCGEDYFDLVVVAMPNHYLTQLCCEDQSLCDAFHDVIAHYDLPAHYLRVSLLYEDPWWDRFKIPGDFWMMDIFNGCCCYNESARWRSRKGHVLSFLLAGQAALTFCSDDQDDEEIISELLLALPDFMCDEAVTWLVEAQVDRFAGSINAQPGGWPSEELRGEHTPEPSSHPGIFLVGDYLFDSTLNAALVSASTAIDCLLGHLGVEGGKGTPAVESLIPDRDAKLSLS